MRLVFKKKTDSRTVARLKKKVRVRKVVIGSAERPRLSVYRSLKAIYAQLIDDATGTTLLSASTLAEKGVSKNVKSAKELGKKVAEMALEKKIQTVVFDRNGYLYHGKVKAFADSAREAGLKF